MCEGVCVKGTYSVCWLNVNFFSASNNVLFTAFLYEYLHQNIYT